MVLMLLRQYIYKLTIPYYLYERDRIEKETIKRQKIFMQKENEDINFFFYLATGAVLFCKENKEM